MKLRRRLYSPSHPAGPSRGTDVRMVKRALGKVEASLLPAKPGGYDDVFNERTAEALDVFRRLTPGLERRRGLPFAQADLDALEPYFDAYGRMRYRLYRPPTSRVPALGPVVAGGKSVLEHDLTHATAGVPGYPAFDDGWYIGIACIAPEPLVVTKQSGAQGGDAFYARGETCDWWFGHIAAAPPTGRRFRKGERFGVISADHPRPHLHVGINTQRLIGRELVHRTDYRHGAPTVGVQLRRALG